MNDKDQKTPEGLPTPTTSHTFYRTARKPDGSGTFQEPFTIDVQFSEPEMINLTKAHSIIRGEGSVITQLGARSSGFERSLLTDTPIPWGYQLQERGTAVEAIVAAFETATQAHDYLESLNLQVYPEETRPLLQQERVDIVELVEALQDFIPASE